MVGLLRWNQEGRFLRPIPLREVNILHVRFLCADMSRGERMSAAAERRKLRSAGKKLLRQGIERVVLPSDVPADALPGGPASGGDAVPAAGHCCGLVRGAAEAPGREPCRGAGAGDGQRPPAGDVVRTVTELAPPGIGILLMEVPYGGRSCAVACGGNTACRCCCIPAPGRRRIFAGL